MPLAARVLKDEFVELNSVGRPAGICGLSGRSVVSVSQGLGNRIRRPLAAGLMHGLIRLLQRQFLVASGLQHGLPAGSGTKKPPGRIRS